MKKIIIILLCLSMCTGMILGLTACDGAGSPDPATDGCTTVVCTNFAGLAFARSLLDTYSQNGGAGKVELTVLGKPGQDMHSYEPTAADIITLAGADVVVCTGAEGWLDAAISSSGNQSLTRVAMMEVCDTMEGEHDHNHSHADESCALIGQDEHVWLSVNNAIRITAAISHAIKNADPDNTAAWQACEDAALAELMTLQGEYTAMMESATRKTVVIADRYPFAYLFRDLGITCIAAFPGCSSETSASFETQTMLIEAVKTNQLPYIFIMEGSDGKVADTVASGTGAEILTLNSLQVVTDYENTTYLDVMRKNLENLKKALQ